MSLETNMKFTIYVFQIRVGKGASNLCMSASRVYSAECVGWTPWNPMNPL